MLKVSFGLAVVSGLTVTEIDCFRVPGLKVRTPETALKSVPAWADPSELA